MAKLYVQALSNFVIPGYDTELSFGKLNHRFAYRSLLCPQL